MNELKKSDIILIIVLLAFSTIVGSSILIKRNLVFNENEDIIKPEIVYDTLTEISINDDIVKDNFAKVSKLDDFIFKYEGITKDNIPNEFKLRAAYSNQEKDLVDLGEDYFNKTGQSYAIRLQDMYTEMKDLFGSNVSYTPEDFKLLEDDFSTGDGLPKFIYNKSELRFETNFEFGGALRGFVNQEVIKAEAFKEELYIYVVPAFYKLQYSKYNGEFYDVYSEYDYEKEKFSNIIKEKVEYTYRIDSDITDKLTIYKYTFTKEDTGYKLIGIDKQEN